MSLTAYLFGVGASLAAPFFTKDEPRTLGADDVQAAINEMNDITERDFIATLGEPELRDYGGFFQDDWKVIVPVTASDYADPGPLVFDLPRGVSDDDSLLYRLMDVTGADTVHDIEGTEVPMEVVGGNTMVFWDALAAPSEESKFVPEDEQESDEAGDPNDD
ncbi:hypothetical protein [Halomonas sp.]|uniref:hypothetical protein n=1 Tax=Halomonas sp. TaxID=1486246 RepID=UPI00356B20A8